MAKHNKYLYGLMEGFEVCSAKWSSREYYRKLSRAPERHLRNIHELNAMLGNLGTVRVENDRAEPSVMDWKPEGRPLLPTNAWLIAKRETTIGCHS